MWCNIDTPSVFSDTPPFFTASHAWIFASEIQLNISSGAGPDDGHPTYLSSYQSELGDILAASYIIYRICIYYNITSGTAKLYCDNKGTVTQSRKPNPLGITPFLTSDYDLLGSNPLYPEHYAHQIGL